MVAGVSACLRPLTLVLLVGGALASLGCSALTEPNEIEVTILPDPPKAPPPSAAAQPAPGMPGMPAQGAAPAGGG